MTTLRHATVERALRYFRLLNVSELKRRRAEIVLNKLVAKIPPSEMQSYIDESTKLDEQFAKSAEKLASKEL